MEGPAKDCWLEAEVPTHQATRFLDDGESARDETEKRMRRKLRYERCDVHSIWPRAIYFHVQPDLT